jgi:hypothetical protein
MMDWNAVMLHMLRVFGFPDDIATTFIKQQEESQSNPQDMMASMMSQSPEQQLLQNAQQVGGDPLAMSMAGKLATQTPDQIALEQVQQVSGLQ